MSFKNKIVSFQIYKKGDPTIQMTVIGQQVAENKTVISDIQKSASMTAWQAADELARVQPFKKGDSIDDSLIDTFTASLKLFACTKDTVVTTVGSTTLSSFVKVEDIADDSIIEGVSVVFAGAPEVLTAAVTGKVDLVATHRIGTLVISKTGYVTKTIENFVALTTYTTGAPYIVKIAAV